MKTEWATERITDEQGLSEAFRIRKQVFVQEQGVPPDREIDEFDNLDGSCEHILLYCNQQPVGTGRTRIVNGTGKLERICVLEPYRRFGLGKAITEALEQIAQEKGASTIKLHGQLQAAEFYQKLGYQASSEVFIEEGIPHILMLKQL